MTNSERAQRFVALDSDVIITPAADDNEQATLAEPTRANEPQQIGATQQQALEFWRHYDELDATIREGWLDGYMSPAWEVVRQHVGTNLSDIVVQNALNEHHNALIDTWIGTPDKPGAITALFMAGAIAGDKSLARGGGVKPHRAGIAAPAVSFDIVSQESLNFVRQYAFGLIRNIDATTIEYVRKTVDGGIEAGQSFDDIGKALDEVFHNPARAKLIAQSEGMNSYNQGAVTRWEQAGVTQGKWHTVGQSACSICKRLNGQVADLRTGWTDPETGIVYRHSAHPGDRCFREPVL